METPPTGLLRTVAHLLEFRVVPGHEAEVTGYLRQSILKARAPAGMRMRCFGRRLLHNQPEHIVGTCWQDEAAFAAGTDRRGVPKYLAPEAGVVEVLHSSAFEISTAIGDGLDGAEIVRVLRSVVAADLTEAWKRDTAGSADWIRAHDGLVLFQAGVSLAAPTDGQVSVATLSAWRDWDAVLVATGGRLGNLIRNTRFDEVERLDRLAHYELLGAETQ